MAVGVSVPAWEYADRYCDFKKALGFSPRVESDSITAGNNWSWCQEIAFQALRSDLNAGWEVDQTTWGPMCIDYRHLRVGITSWDLGYWIAYILLSLITAGLGFLFLPFVMKKDYVELRGVEVRLQRWKKA